jgi:UDP-N-acetylmuramoyl-tripeptide--D-alanyl-D-alanine ligase
VLGPVLRRAERPLCLAAWLWRRALRGTTFVAVTGSLGKTTTKECLAAVLGTRLRTARSRGNQNSTLGVALNLLRVRPWHRVAVLEVGAAMPGQMARSARLVRPDVAVALNVRPTHTIAYRDLAAHAAEKARLLAALAPGGLAVLNGDDPHVAAMAGHVPGDVVRIGSSPAFDVWADEVTAPWPAGLGFRVHLDGARRRVETQLLGTHWLPGALAALAVARHLGIGLADAAGALAAVRPFRGRLEPVRLPAGATLLRDDYNASVEAFDSAAAVLRGAAGVRRVLVVSDISDAGGNRKHRLRHLARVAAESADVLLVIGESAAFGRREAIRAGLPPAGVHAAATVAEAARLLPTLLAPGDLVLLKGRTTDHVSRLFFAQVGRVDCWKAACPKRIPCDECWELGPAGDVAAGASAPAARGSARPAPACR